MSSLLKLRNIALDFEFLLYNSYKSLFCLFVVKVLIPCMQSNLVYFTSNCSTNAKKMHFPPWT